MKLLVSFCVLTILTTVGAVLTRGWPRRLGWGLLALNCAAAALAYVERSPAFWGKGSDGKLNSARWLVTLPLHGFNQIVFQTLRSVTASRPFDEVQPGLFLGRRLTGREATLKEFRTVLDLTSEFTEPVRLRQATNYLCVPVLDHTPPTPTQLRAALDFLTTHEADGPVLVHCAAGHGRSALVLAAWLVQRGRATNASDALAQLQRVRPNVALNREQRASLEEFTRRLPANSGAPRQ
jgi:hypothetical protein